VFSAWSGPTEFYTLKQFGNKAPFTSPITFHFHLLFCYTLCLSLSLPLLCAFRLPNYIFKLCPSINQKILIQQPLFTTDHRSYHLNVNNQFIHTLRLLSITQVPNKLHTGARHCRTMLLVSCVPATLLSLSTSSSG
jgi:hypothetical protein